MANGFETDEAFAEGMKAELEGDDEPKKASALEFFHFLTGLASYETFVEKMAKYMTENPNEVKEEGEEGVTA